MQPSKFRRDHSRFPVLKKNFKGFTIYKSVAAILIM